MTDLDINVTVGVCTFRRASLFDTLESLACQTLRSDVRLRVIVADNDDSAVLQGKLDQFAARRSLDITYVHAPCRNISIARNACLENTQTDFLLFIDDDEVAQVDWVMNLLGAAELRNAAVVFGPAHAVYPPDAPDWMRLNAFHSNIPSALNGTIETGFSCNTLLDLRNPCVRDTRFDLSFGRTGGEDVDFFFRLHRMGVKMAICSTAIVHEPVAPARLSFRWLLDKTHATGLIYGVCARNGQASRIPGFFTRSSAKAIYCGLRAAICVTNKSRCTFWIMRSSFHFGALKSCFTKPTYEFYGAE